MWSREGFSGFDPDDSHPLDREAESVMASAASRAGGRVSLQYPLGALLAVEVPLRWRRAWPRVGPMNLPSGTRTTVG